MNNLQERKDGSVQTTHANQCELCGKPLTIFTQAWGTKRCRRCATGKSPQAKQEKVFAILEKHPYQDEEHIRAPARRFFAEAFVFALIGDVLAQLIVVLGLLPDGSNLILLGVWLAALGSKVIFSNDHLLNQKRWNSFSIANWLFFFAGVGFLFQFITLSKMQEMRGTVPSHKMSHVMFNVLWIAGIPLFACVGAVVWGIVVDRRKVQSVTELFRQWKTEKTKREHSVL
jgi:hypothetical protein